MVEHTWRAPAVDTTTVPVSYLTEMRQPESEAA
jgi:hypothetical protein